MIWVYEAFLALVAVAAIAVLVMVNINYRRRRAAMTPEERAADDAEERDWLQRW